MYSNQDLLNLYNDADFYDAEFKDRNFEVEFYKEQCCGCSSILEVACGTGRITIPLARSGANIAGTDISKDMIMKAKKNAMEEVVDISFHVQDARFTDGDFDLIFIATNAFQHLLSYQHALEFLNACRSALSPGGKIIIDVQVPNIKKLSRKYSEVRPYKIFSYLGSEIVASLQGSYDNVTQLYQFDIEYTQNQKVVKKKQVAMRMYYPQEFSLLFDIAKLSVLQSYGCYDKSKLKDSSSKQIYVLEQQISDETK